VRNKIVLLFLFFLLIPIYFSSAYIPLPSSTDFGGSANPINIQIQPDYNTQRRQENLLLESQLKIQYGYSIYSSCKYSVCGSNYNAIDPSSESSCLSMLEAWLGGGKCMAQRQKANENTQCATGYVKALHDGWYGCDPIKSDNQICIDKYGSNVMFTEFNKEGTRICDCKVNYQWNQGQTECILIPPKVISSGGGGGSKSTITCNGKEWNNCPVGQKFSCPSTGDAQCLITPKAVTPTTIKVPEVKTIENEVKKDTSSEGTGCGNIHLFCMATPRIPEY